MTREEWMKEPTEEQRILWDLENDINNAKGKEELKDYIMSELYDGYWYCVNSIAINPFMFRYYFVHATWKKATESVMQRLRSEGYITFLKIEDETNDPTYIVKLSERVINELKADENDEY